MDPFSKCFDFTRADEAKASGLYPYFTQIDNVEGNYVWVGGKKTLMVGSNNYLGLFDDERIKKSSKDATDKFGSSTCGSRFLNGTYSLHVDIEKKLAEFIGRDEALTFSTGFQVNLGVIPAVAGRNDIILVDRLVHASVMESARLSFSKIVKFNHNDMNDLEEQIRKIPDEKGKIIIVDGVFSMEGDLANIPEIIKIAKKYSARVIVDDAHGVGVMGKNGRGTCEHFGMESEVDLILLLFQKPLPL